MEIEGESLDDILIRLYRDLPAHGNRNTGTRGETLELIGVTIRLQNPRARLSRSESRGKSFSALGELLWYLSERNDLEFIEAYVPAYKDEADPDGTVHGGYGPRIFAMRNRIDQIASVTDLLRRNPGTRRAVMQLFNAEDIASPHREVPCTTTFQFFQRHGRLHLATTLRSNDAYKGLPHDVFCFTMIQEMMACRLGVELGEYYQFVGSMHVYENNIVDLLKYNEEGYQALDEMPRMPSGDPFAYIPTLLECERRMRQGEDFYASDIFSDPYWADIVRLLQAFWASGIEPRLDELSAQLSCKNYRTYLDTRRKMKPRNAER